MPDLLTAMAEIVEAELFNLPEVNVGKGNRAVSIGESFEIYCKDRLVGLKHGATLAEREVAYDRYLSYKGNSKNPPDAMYKGGNSGDAFEFKKRNKSHTESIQLNSSSPKARLSSSSHMITADCRECELPVKWTERDLIYVFGGISGAKSSALDWIWFVDASLMSAPNESYEDLFHSVRSKVAEVSSLSTSDTKELGRFNEVDLLRATSLRIRAMWILDGPGKFFERIPGVFKESPGRVLYGIMRKAKWERFAESSRKRVLDLKGTTGFSFSEVEAPDPGIAGKSLDAILIRFELPA